jgi:hypothetical protein
MPTKSAMMVSRGRVTHMASSRGVTSFLTGSVPRARVASICSETFIEPSSEAMPEALRQAIEESGEHGAHLTDKGDGGDLTDLSGGAVLGEGAGHFERHDYAGKKTDENRDGQAADADGVHLQEQVLAVRTGVARR